MTEEDSGGFDVLVHEDAPTGYRLVTCPTCGLRFKRATGHGVAQAFCDHMNARHAEPPGRVGHA